IYITLGGLRALAPTGTQIWETELQASAPAAIGPDGTIYVANSDLALYSIGTNGQTNWLVARYSAPLLPTTPAVDKNGTIYYCVSNSLFAISAQGAIQWTFASPFPPAGNHVYDTQTSPVIGPDGTIYAVFGSQIFAFSGTNALADSPWPMYHQNPRH